MIKRKKKEKKEGKGERVCRSCSVENLPVLGEEGKEGEGEGEGKENDGEDEKGEGGEEGEGGEDKEDKRDEGEKEEQIPMGGSLLERNLSNRLEQPQKQSQNEGKQLEETTREDDDNDDDGDGLDSKRTPSPPTISEPTITKYDILAFLKRSPFLELKKDIIVDWTVPVVDNQKIKKYLSFFFGEKERLTEKVCLCLCLCVSHFLDSPIILLLFTLRNFLLEWTVCLKSFTHFALPSLFLPISRRKKVSPFPSKTKHHTPRLTNTNNNNNNNIDYYSLRTQEDYEMATGSWLVIGGGCGVFGSLAAVIEEPLIQVRNEKRRRKKKEEKKNHFPFFKIQ